MGSSQPNPRWASFGLYSRPTKSEFFFLKEQKMNSESLEQFLETSSYAHGLQKHGFALISHALCEALFFGILTI